MNCVLWTAAKPDKLRAIVRQERPCTHMGHGAGLRSIIVMTSIAEGTTSRTQWLPWVQGVD